jgi:hypothetical protein
VASGRQLVALGSAVAGVALSWLLVPIQQNAFDRLGPGRLPYVPDAWFEQYEAIYRELGAPLQLSPYYFWGRFAFLIYLAGLVATWGLPQADSRVVQVGRRLLLVAFGAGLIGDFLAYWGGTNSDDFSTVTAVGYILFEFPAILVMAPATVVYGVGLARAGVRPAFAGWCLALGGALAWPTTLVITYVPHALLLAILTGISLALIGLVAHGRRQAVPPTP